MYSAGSGYQLERPSRSLPEARETRGRVLGGAATPFLRDQVARLPVTLRLALCYALFAAIVVTAIMGGSYWELSTALRERAHAELKGEWQLVHDALASIADGALSANDASAIAALRVNHPGLSIAVFSQHATPLTVLGAEGWELAEAAEQVVRSNVTEIEWPDCMLASLVGDAKTAEGTPIRLAVAIDRTADRQLLTSYRTWLASGSLIGILAIAVLAGFFARRSLMPLRKFGAQIAAISASRLGRRIDERNVPRELHEFARTFNRLLENLEEAFARLRAFSSDIAHELRSPLANVVLKTQVTLSRSRTATEYRQTLEFNAGELQRMTYMVSDMVFLAQVENAAAALELTEIDLFHLARNVVEFYELAAQERDIRIEVAGHASVRADRKLFQRAVGNLLSNAIRHTPHGKTIEVRITTMPQDFAVIEVENPGPGIAPSLQSRIFERFVRGYAASQAPDAASGAGLGLAIVRSIMSLHGGTASVSSRPEGPTIFSLQFPTRPASAE